MFTWLFHQLKKKIYILKILKYKIINTKIMRKNKKYLMEKYIRLNRWIKLFKTDIWKKTWWRKKCYVILRKINWIICFYKQFGLFDTFIMLFKNHFFLSSIFLLIFIYISYIFLKTIFIFFFVNNKIQD